MAFRLILIGIGILSTTLVFGASIDIGAAHKQLKWPGRTIRIAVSSNLFTSISAIKAESDVNGAIVRALQHWETAANVDFEVGVTEVSVLSPHSLTGDGISVITIGSESENLLAFQKKNPGEPGVTRVFYDSQGIITEADIALNPGQQFSTDRTTGTFDLEWVLTHEIGHLLGLAHSLDPSAVMFDGVPRNGGYETATVFRSISSDDITKIRSVYGVNDYETSCCVTIRGRVGTANDQSGKYLVWLQDARNGSLVQVNIADAKSQSRFGGIDRGRYEVIVQSFNRDDVFFSASISEGKDVDASADIAVIGAMKRVSFDIRFIGLNGQLTRRAVNVEAGNTYRFFVAGPGLKQQDLRFGATSPGIAIDTNVPESPVFANSLANTSFDLSISRTVPPGRYSIYAEDRSGSRRYFVGGIVVRSAR